MASDMGRKKKGKKTKTKLSMEQLQEFASKVASGKKVMGFGKK